MSTVFSPINIVRTKGAAGPGSVGGFTSGNEGVMPWERAGNPLDKYVLPGTEALTPGAIKARGKRTIGGTLGGGGTGTGSGGAGAGPAGVSYVPGGSPIGKALPKAWSGPQGTFEAAKARGEVTPEKIAQAQAFAAANGRTFDPALGYSTNKVPAQPPAPGATMPGSLAPVAAPATAVPSPAVAVPFVGPPAPGRDNDPALARRLREQGVGMGAAAGMGSVPVQALAGKTFWTGEKGPELQHVSEDGQMTIVPHAMIKAAGIKPPKKTVPPVAFAAMAGGQGYADGTMVDEMHPPPGWAAGAMAQDAPIGAFAVPGLSPGEAMQRAGMRENARAPMVSPTFAPTGLPAPAPAMAEARAVRSPAGPVMAFPTGMPTGGGPGFAPAFSPTFAPSLTAPAGVRQTDFRRFLRTPQGMQFALGREAQQQGMAMHSQGRMAALNTERQWQMEDRQSAQQQKAAEEARTSAAYDQLFGALTSDQAALPPVFKDLLASAKDVKSKAALHDLVLGYLGNQATRDAVQKQQAAEEAARIRGEAPIGMEVISDPSGQYVMPVAKLAGGGRVRAGAAEPVRQAKDLTLKLTQLPTGEYVYQHPETGSPILDLGTFDKTAAGYQRRAGAPKPERVITDPITLGAAAVETDPTTGRALGLRRLDPVAGAAELRPAKSAASQNKDDIERLLGGRKQ